MNIHEGFWRASSHECPCFSDLRGCMLWGSDFHARRGIWNHTNADIWKRPDKPLTPWSFQRPSSPASRCDAMVLHVAHEAHGDLAAINRRRQMAHSLLDISSTYRFPLWSSSSRSTNSLGIALMPRCAPEIAPAIAAIVSVSPPRRIALATTCW